MKTKLIIALLVTSAALIAAAPTTAAWDPVACTKLPADQELTCYTAPVYCVYNTAPSQWATQCDPRNP